MNSAPARPLALDDLPAWQQRIIALTRRLPDNWLGKRLSFLLRRPVLRALGTRSVDAEVLGARMRLQVHDNLSEKRVLFTPQFFDPVERRALAERFHPGFCFVDIGANAGVFSLFVASHAGPTAKVLAVEPQPVMLERLRTNIALSGLHNITVAPCAASDREGRITLRLNAHNRGQASIAASDGEAVEVATRPLAALLDEAGITTPDALKIDIEGAEDLVLGQMLDSLPRERWPRLILVERNAPMWQQDILARCLAEGYQELDRGHKNALLVRP